jgi:hypothetical protein
MSTVRLKNQAAPPGAPAAGYTRIYVDDTGNKLATVDEFDVVTIYTDGEKNLGANVGAGLGWFRDKTGITLNFRTAVQGASMLLTGAADTITVALGVLSQALDGGNQDIHSIKTATFEALVDNGNSGAAKTVDWNSGSMQKVTMSANCTFTFTAPPGVGRFQLRLIQDATGSRTATWPASVKWSQQSGTPPALTSTPARWDTATFTYDGSIYEAVITKNFTP